MPRYSLNLPSSDSDDELDLYDHSTLSRDRGRNAHRRPRAERVEGVTREQAMPQALKDSDVVSGFKNTADHKRTKSHSEQPQSISDRLKCCMLDFKHMLDSTSLARYTHEVPLDLWQEQYQRLQGWASNIGAYAQDASSLDFRLREASGILEHVDSLIRSIQADLAAIESHVKHVGSGKDSGDTQSNSDSDSTTMLQELYTSIDSYVTDLLKVSIIIRNSTSYEKIMQLDSDLVAQLAPWFIQHVREKFPGCDTSVCERLGRAIARRRAEIEYRRKQSEKRKRGLARFLCEQDHLEEKSQTPTKFTDFAETIRPTESDSRTETTSQTGYSDLDATSVDGGLSIPPPPRESANGKPFDCPYCFNPTSIQRAKDWTRHVLRDALPYMCLFRECSTDDKLYASRSEYYKHLRRAHSTSLRGKAGRLCLLCRKVPSETFSIHLSHHLIQLALFSLQPYDAEVDEGKEAITEAHFEDSDTSSGSLGADTTVENSDAWLQGGADDTDMAAVFIKNVSSAVDRLELRRELENFGRLTSFASLGQGITFARFEESSSALAAMFTSPLRVGVGQVLITPVHLEGAEFPVDKLFDIQRIFDKVYNPKVNSFRADAPAELAARYAAYTSLKKGVLDEVIYKAADLDFEGYSAAGLLRTSLIDKANAAIGVLDSLYDTAPLPRPLSSQSNEDEIVQNPYETLSTRTRVPERDPKTGQMYASNTESSAQSDDDPALYRDPSPGQVHTSHGERVAQSHSESRTLHADTQETLRREVIDYSMTDTDPDKSKRKAVEEPPPQMYSDSRTGQVYADPAYDEPMIRGLYSADNMMRDDPLPRRRDEREVVDYSLRDDADDYGSRGKTLYDGYFVKGTGIDREVIQHEVTRYLGNDATVRPMTHQDGNEGYLVSAYRPFTSAMIEVLRRVTYTWRLEQDRRSRDNRNIDSYSAWRSSGFDLQNQRDFDLSAAGTTNPSGDLLVASRMLLPSSKGVVPLNNDYIVDRAATAVRSDSAAVSSRSDMSVEIGVCSRTGDLFRENAVFSLQHKGNYISTDLAHKLGYQGDRHVTLTLGFEEDMKTFRSDFEVRPNFAPSTMVLGEQTHVEYEAYKMRAFPITRSVGQSRENARATDLSKKSK